MDWYVTSAGNIIKTPRLPSRKYWLDVPRNFQKGHLRECVIIRKDNLWSNLQYNWFCFRECLNEPFFSKWNCVGIPLPVLTGGFRKNDNNKLGWIMWDKMKLLAFTEFVSRYFRPHDVLHDSGTTVIRTSYACPAKQNSLIILMYFGGISEYPLKVLQ